MAEEVKMDSTETACEGVNCGDVAYGRMH